MPILFAFIEIMPPIPKYQELLSSEDAELDFESQRTVKPDTFLSVVSIKILLISSLVLNGLLLLRSTKRHATEEDGASIYGGLYKPKLLISIH